MVGVQAWVLADDLSEVVEPSEHPLARRGLVRGAVQGDLEAPVLQFQDPAPIVGVVQGLPASAGRPQRGDEPDRLRRPQAELRQKVVDRADVLHGREVGIVHDGKRKPLALGPCRLRDFTRYGIFLPGPISWPPALHNRFECCHCGYSTNADFNAARNIQARAIVSWPMVGVEEAKTGLRDCG